MKKFVALLSIISLVLVLNGCFFKKSEPTLTEVTDTQSSEKSPVDESKAVNSETVVNEKNGNVETSSSTVSNVASEKANNIQPGSKSSPTTVRDGTINYDKSTSPSGGEMGQATGLDSPGLLATSERFLDYSPDIFTSLKGTQPVALFFYASWCSICTSLEKEIISSKNDIPENSTILKVNFDTETELKESLKVYAQSTVVVFDKRGNIMNKLLRPNFEKIRTELIAGKL